MISNLYGIKLYYNKEYTATTIKQILEWPHELSQIDDFHRSSNVEGHKKIMYEHNPLYENNILSKS